MGTMVISGLTKSGMKKKPEKSSSDWSNKFQPEAVTVSVANHSGHPRLRWGAELELQHIAGIQQDPGIQQHAAFAHLGSAAGNHGLVRLSRGNDANLQIDGMPWPSARVLGKRHFCQSFSFPSRHSNYEGVAHRNGSGENHDGHSPEADCHGDVAQSQWGRTLSKQGRRDV